MGVQLQVSTTASNWRMWVIAREVDGRQNVDKTQEVDDWQQRNAEEAVNYKSWLVWLMQEIIL